MTTPKPHFSATTPLNYRAWFERPRPTSAPAPGQRASSVPRFVTASAPLAGSSTPPVRASTPLRRHDICCRFIAKRRALLPSLIATAQRTLCRQTKTQTARTAEDVAVPVPQDPLSSLPVTHDSLDPTQLPTLISTPLFRRRTPRTPTHHRRSWTTTTNQVDPRRTTIVDRSIYFCWWTNSQHCQIMTSSETQLLVSPLYTGRLSEDELWFLRFTHYIIKLLSCSDSNNGTFHLVSLVLVIIVACYCSWCSVFV